MSHIRAVACMLMMFGRVRENDELLARVALAHVDKLVRPHTVHGEHDV